MPDLHSLFPVKDEAGTAESAILEEVAKHRGCEVRRYAGDLLECRRGNRRMLFRGLVGSASARVSHLLAANPAAVRRLLAERSLPVVDTRLVSWGDARYREHAEAIGYPLVVRIPGEAGVLPVKGAEELGLVWGHIADLPRRRHTHILLEARAIDDASIDIAVVNGEVVATSPRLSRHSSDLAAAVRSLATSTVATVPGVTYASVRTVVAEPSSGREVLRVEWIDPAFAAWRREGSAEVALIAEAILFSELG
ncbi:hypothetical protein JQS43_02425 [Natronosporangium hydrolyticum]|uniref:ATP-grasp domain-containing protein n=1 Tax=Natronosporangium hydrolyticum TaxID=2811111 RepID=A0A895YMB3_9ACTN|nr:hypothetical protein [Natronosporangium hydrolyticum]QSB15240.1 hypothetical protein JQS43_02425 [Natronosporangium hydrolyticum]